MNAAIQDTRPTPVTAVERTWLRHRAGPIMPTGNLAGLRLIGAGTLGVAVAPGS